MSFRHRKFYAVLGSLAAIAIAVTATVPALSQTSTALSQLTAQEQSALEEGQATVTGQNGQFTGRVLVNASAATTWQVLTDYDNFDQFLPNIEASRLLESTGDRRVFEQVNVVRFFPITRRSRVVIASTLSYPQQINFSLVEGDLDELQGSWRLETVASPGGDQLLITHQVTVDPKGSSATRGLFFNTYRNVLEDTLAALKQESERRTEGDR
ncbi:MAG: SRPBCC family protein [Elainellaceae cyanobacterium]